MRGALILIAGLLATCPVASAQPSSLDFLRPAQILSATLSPDGGSVAIAEFVDDHAAISVHDVATSTRQRVFHAGQLLGIEKSYIRRVQWIDDQFVAVVISESRSAVAELLDTTSTLSTYIVDTLSQHPGQDAQVFEVRTRGQIVHALPNEPGTFLYGRSNIVSQVYRLAVDDLGLVGQRLGRSSRIDGGQFVSANEVFVYDGFVLRWFVQSNLKKTSVFAIRADARLVISAFDDQRDEWDTMKSWEGLEEFSAADDSFIPIAIGPDRDEYYAVARQEGQSAGLFLHNVVSGDSRLIYRHATADVQQVISDSKSARLTAVGILDNGNVHFEYIDEDLGIAAAQLANRVQADRLRLIEHDSSKQRFLLETHSFGNPGKFLLWHRLNDELETIAMARPWLDAVQLAPIEVGSVLSHELEIPYLLAVPPTGNAPFPLILLPHGGPIGVVDADIYDGFSQLLVNSGFAVLQVNYRGSAGYSDQFLDAGKREWGGKILDDILAAFAVVSGRAEIDGNRVCAVGGSYGGYAALMLGTRHPDLFRCIVSISGVTDINLLLTDANLSTADREWLLEYVGDPVDDFENLASISPAYLTQQADLPIFLAHGQRDRVVDVEHLHRLASNLRRQKINFQISEISGASHSLLDMASAGTLIDDLLRFLDSHLK